VYTYVHHSIVGVTKQPPAHTRPHLHQPTRPIQPTTVQTNCTYDGLCIDVARAEQLLGASVDRIHFGTPFVCVCAWRLLGVS
jgi:arginine/lysine/ornithine decarboxylase